MTIQHMTIQHILVVMPPDYIHSQAFFEIALSFSQALKSLGHPAEVTTDTSAVFGKTLVFGAHLLPKYNGTIEGGDYIIFNTEQYTPDSPWFTPEYLEILKRYEVWDYSRNNIAGLREHMIEAKFCEIGYSPCMSNIRWGKAATVTGGNTAPVKVDWVNNPSAGNAVGVYDVLFYGSINERRQKIIDDLRAAGIQVVTLVGYGAYRDKHIATARIVLNVHYYESGIFEIFRVAHLLANQKCVVSELGREPELEDPYRCNIKNTPMSYCGVAFAYYENIVHMCKLLLENDKFREEVTKAGFEAIKSRPQADILRELV